MRIRMKALLFFFQSLLIYASTRRGGVAEWSCSGLQLRGRRFDSDLRLHLVKARVVKSVDTGDLKSPAHKACQFESGLGHHSYTSKYGAYKEPSVKLVFLCLNFHTLFYVNIIVMFNKRSRYDPQQASFTLFKSVTTTIS